VLHIMMTRLLGCDPTAPWLVAADGAEMVDATRLILEHRRTARNTHPAQTLVILTLLVLSLPIVPSGTRCNALEALAVEALNLTRRLIKQNLLRRRLDCERAWGGGTVAGAPGKPKAQPRQEPPGSSSTASHAPAQGVGPVHNGTGMSFGVGAGGVTATVMPERALEEDHSTSIMGLVQEGASVALL
jgi:hypothetical protein